MENLGDVEMAVIDWLKKTKHKPGKSKYKYLVESSVQLDAEGCNGFIIMEVEEYTRKILDSYNEELLKSIWNSTEQAEYIRGAADSDHELFLCKVEMLRDISMDMIQMVSNRVCDEAKNIIKQKERKKKRDRPKKEFPAG